jgi:SAM-dependent methyltransferase
VITSNDYDLDSAYAIRTPADARRLYGDWAATYDQSFAQAWGYIAPREIAGIFKSFATPADQPILDVGAGTGLVASELPGLVVDGIDIAAPMLAVAAAKGLYRQRIIADLTQPLDIAGERYGGFVSCGTFTHGHVGPVCLEELLRIGRPNALFCVGTIPSVFDQAGFGSAFALLVAAGRITPLSFRNIPIYEGAHHPHAKDRGLVAIFRKT